MAESKESACRRAIKIHSETGCRSHLVELLSTVKTHTSMANQGKGKDKMSASQEEEIASCGKLERVGGLREHGDPSHGRGAPAQTPVWQGGPAVQGARYGGSGEAVAPVFPVRVEDMPPNVVSLNLAKERAAMRSRWLAVGLFFSVQLFSVSGLFQELRNKWWLRR